MLSNQARISLFIFSTLLVLLSLSFLVLTPPFSLSLHLPFHEPKPATPRPVVTTTFRPIPALEDLSLAADPAWAALLPGDGGFLNVRYNETYVQAWGISAFHALHCLAMIRGALQSASGLRADGGSSYGQGHGHGGGGGDTGVGDHYWAPEHLMHCFSYLAQVSGLSDQVPVGKRGGHRGFLLTGCAIDAAVQWR
ncbi:MAG: hypothetical protein FRX48_02975 [Lasallia pustulata]|uniref:Uncharacterized protein n=1 Tax=Lasallia pustulata TaxID=136370 RepID=A0A5M8PVY6_9LECA|nr:MAG: hypothetical protein FRX48_02975 [Lasallia pustulata]